MNKKRRLVAIIIILLTISAGVLFWLGKSKEAVAPVEMEEQAKQDSASQPAEVASEENQDGDWQVEDFSKWKTYRNEYVGIEIKMPSDWNMIDKSEVVTGLIEPSFSIESPYIKEIEIGKDKIKEGGINVYCSVAYSSMLPTEFIKTIGVQDATPLKNFEHKVFKIGRYQAIEFPILDIDKEDGIKEYLIIIGDGKDIYFFNYDFAEKDERIAEIMKKITINMKVFKKGCNR